MAGFEDLSDAQKLALAQAAHKLFQNPEVNKDAKRLLMKADPSVKFPEIETQDQFQSELTKRDDKIKELSDKQMEVAAQHRREAMHEQARERGLKPEDVEDAIVKKGIANWDTAMEYVELSQRAAPSTPASFESNLETPGAKEMWKDPKKWAREQAHAAIDEISKRRNAR